MTGDVDEVTVRGLLLGDASSLERLISALAAADETLQSVVVDLSSRWLADDQDRLLGIRLLGLCFAVRPEIAASVLSREEVFDSLCDALKHGDAQQQESILELYSTACVDSGCRGSLARLAPLFGEFAMRDSTSGALALCLLIKLGKLQQDRDLSDRFFEIVRTSQIPSVQRVLLEALAILSMSAQFKTSIMTSQPVLVCMKHVLKDQSDALALSSTLTIVLNLVFLPKFSSLEQSLVQKISELTTKSGCSSGEPDQEEATSRRRRTIVKQDFVPLLTPLYDLKSSFCRTTLSKIFISLASEKELRIQMVQQGSLKALVAYTNRVHPDYEESQEMAAQAISKLLISVNPMLAFNSSHHSPSTAVLPLLAIASSPSSSVFAIFEALLALTNLASVDETSCTIVVAKGWNAIESLLMDESPALRRAVTELICNLSVSDSTLPLFTTDKSARQRVTNLLIYLDSTDRATQLAAGGSLALLSRNPMVCRHILALEENMGVNCVVQSISSDDEDIVIRGLSCAENLIEHLFSFQEIEFALKTCIEKKNQFGQPTISLAASLLHNIDKSRLNRS